MLGLLDLDVSLKLSSALKQLMRVIQLGAFGETDGNVLGVGAEEDYGVAATGAVAEKKIAAPSSFHFHFSAGTNGENQVSGLAR